MTTSTVTTNAEEGGLRRNIIILTHLSYGLIAMFLFVVSYHLGHNHPTGGASGGQAGASQQMEAEQMVMMYMQQLQKDPENVELLTELSSIFYSMDQYGQAESFLKRAVALAPEDPVLWQGLAATQAYQRKFEEAVANFEKELTLKDNPHTRHNLAHLYISQLNNVEKGRIHAEAVMQDASAPAELKASTQELLDIINK